MEAAKSKLIHEMSKNMEEHVNEKLDTKGGVVAINVMGGYHTGDLTDYGNITEAETFPSTFGTNAIGGMNISEQLHDRMNSEDRGMIPLCDSMIEYDEWDTVKEGDILTLCREGEEPIKIKIGSYCMSCFHPHHWKYDKVG